MLGLGFGVWGLGFRVSVFRLFRVLRLGVSERPPPELTEPYYIDFSRHLSSRD